jgi:hypothetical protein
LSGEENAVVNRGKDSFVDGVTLDTWKVLVLFFSLCLDGQQLQYQVDFNQESML